MDNFILCSITEENFWRNYFYRVQLIIQAGDLGTLGTDNAFGQRDEDGKLNYLIGDDT